MERQYDADGEIEIDLSTLEPLCACPHQPDNVRPLREVEKKKVQQVFIGRGAKVRFWIQTAAEDALDHHGSKPPVQKALIQILKGHGFLQLDRRTLENISPHRRANGFLGQNGGQPIHHHTQDLLLGGQRPKPCPVFGRFQDAGRRIL